MPQVSYGEFTTAAGRKLEVSRKLNEDGSSLSDPSALAEAVTPHASTNFTNGTCRGIYVGAAGDVTAIVGGAAITFVGVPAGTILPIRATRVNAVGTDATDMVALF